MCIRDRLASKPAALVFPAILFVLDYYKDRPLNLNAIKQKVPFIIFSGIMVYLTLHSQTTAGATDTKNTIELSKRIFFPFYGYMTVSYTHLRAHETVLDLVCRLLLEKKKIQMHI